jgi:hypothetical protein
MKFKTAKPVRVMLSAPVGFRTSTILKVDGKYCGEFYAWDKLDPVLAAMNIRVPLYKKLALCLFNVDLNLA